MKQMYRLLLMAVLLVATNILFAQNEKSADKNNDSSKIYQMHPKPARNKNTPPPPPPIQAGEVEMPTNAITENGVESGIKSENLLTDEARPEQSPAVTHKPKTAGQNVATGKNSEKNNNTTVNKITPGNKKAAKYSAKKKPGRKKSKKAKIIIANKKLAGH